MIVIMSGRWWSLQLVFLFILLSLYTKSAIVLSSQVADHGHIIKCIERERHALLMIKQSLIDEYGHLSSWGNEQDKKDNCCKWRGVGCSNQTGNVVKLNLQVTSFFFDKPLKGNISSSLVELQHLNYLDMSFNDFGGQQIPEFIGSLNKLKHLSLSDANLQGRIPYQLGNLSRLQSLDLSTNFGMYAEKLEWLSHLSNLRYLQLDNVQLTNAVDWLQVVSELPYLTKLQLQGCNLPSVMSSSPIAFVNSSEFLTLLDLSGNNLSNSINPFLFTSRSSLVTLDLSYNKIQGHIPDHALWNMSSLLYLDLTGNGINGIPKSFGNLCGLKTLFLESNNLTGQLPELFLNLSGCTKNTLQVLRLNNNMLSGSLPDFTLFSSLRELYLYENRLNGSFPNSLAQLSNLTRLDLSRNQLVGSFPDGFSAILTSIESLDVSSNRLNGSLPESIGQLSTLLDLDVSSNFLEGVITEAHMSNLSRLESIDFSYNLLTLNFSSDWVPPFQLQTIRLGACKQGPHVPKWLQTQRIFLLLDISNAGISDTIPNWFWDLSPNLNVLNLSHNHISGMLPDLSLKFAGYPGIDLSYNNLEGPIPPVPANMTSLILSKNNFSGSISFVCAITGEYFSYLDLSDNQLSGELPDCWMHLQKLTILNLANNKLSGNFPNSTDSNCMINSLHLRNNSFTGELPSSLNQCTQLTVVDLGNNKFSGTIPAWIGDSLPELAILSLRSNQFHGSLPVQLCNLGKVQVLDFSQNHLSGSIPKCLDNLTMMAQKESSNAFITYLIPFSLTSGMGGDVANFQDNAWLVWKGIDSEYKSTQGLVKSIDLSNNNLSGEIPKEITNLVGLISLNLSRNSLTGKIPPKIGQLNWLNSLDLSRNLLTGEIPESFSQLNLLGVLNLSYNNLSGKIPLDNKLQSFDALAYKGNPELCGDPLPDKCPGNEPPDDQSPAITFHEDEDGFVTLGFYVSLVLGFIIGFWGVCGTLLLNRSWRFAYFRFLNDVKDRLYVLLAVNMANLKQKLRS